MAILPFSTLFFMALQGFIYTISVDIYAFRLAFSSILHCILHHFAFLVWLPAHYFLHPITHF